MNCSQLLHLHHILDHTDLRRLDIITAFIDNDFPVEEWEKDGALEANVYWVEEEYENYGKGGHRGLHDMDDFLYCVAEALYADNHCLRYIENADMDRVYDLLEMMN